MPPKILISEAEAKVSGPQLMGCCVLGTGRRFVRRQEPKRTLDEIAKADMVVVRRQGFVGGSHTIIEVALHSGTNAGMFCILFDINRSNMT